MYYYTLLDDWDSNHFYEQKPIQSFVNTIFLIYAPNGSVFTFSTLLHTHLLNFLLV